MNNIDWNDMIATVIVGVLLIASPFLFGLTIKFIVVSAKYGWNLL